VGSTVRAEGRRRRPSPRLLALAASVTVLGVAHAAGLTEPLGERERLQTLLAESGAWGPLTFVVIFAVCHVLALPSVLLVFVAAALWPLGVALGLSWTGGMIGTHLSYGAAAWLGGDWVAGRLSPRLRRLDGWLTGGGAEAVGAARLLLFLPPPVDWLLGVSSVRLRDFTVGTALGQLPPLTVLAAAGAWMSGQRGVEGLLLGGAAVALGVAFLGMLALRARRAPSRP
jgi:uncharacterized membrane protein YdjX (TVP38/TMEM64 family)